MTEVVRRSIALLFYVENMKPQRIEITTSRDEKVSTPPFLG
jgi:hypothetical protein